MARGWRNVQLWSSSCRQNKKKENIKASHPPHPKKKKKKEKEKEEEEEEERKKGREGRRSEEPQSTVTRWNQSKIC